MRLTPTQKIILKAAAENGRGLVDFGPGDRRGTRVAGYRQLDGTPIIIAYAWPEVSLVSRKLLRPYGNERHRYEITNAGLDAVAARQPG